MSSNVPLARKKLWSLASMMHERGEARIRDLIVEDIIPLLLRDGYEMWRSEASRPRSTKNPFTGKPLPPRGKPLRLKTPQCFLDAEKKAQEEKGQENE